MKTLFTNKTFILLFLAAIIHNVALGQVYTGRIVNHTVKSSDFEEEFHYYPMAGFNSSAYKEYSYIKEEEGKYMNMRLLFPEDYDSSANDGKEYPLILMLHGAGESAFTDWDEPGHPDYPADDPRNNNNDHQLKYGGLEHLNAVRNRPPTDPRHWPGFVLFPQAKRNGSWADGENDMVIEILELLIDSLKIDPLRIYVWGLSNGAKGTWDVINRRPDLFAGALPMSGVYLVDYDKLAHMPIWLFQGEKDGNPTPNAAQTTLDRLRAAGGTPRYTLYEGVGHGTWGYAYAEDDFYTWMLQYSELTIHPFYGKTEFCAGDPIDAKLGISPGHFAYQWRWNGEPIPGADSYNYIAHELGEYQVRIQLEEGDEWTEWSKPVEIKIRDPYYPEITVSGSTTFPTNLDDAENVTLSYDKEYFSNQIFWDRNKNGTSWGTQQNGVSSITVGGVSNAIMYYRVELIDTYGCASEFSDTVAVTRGAPVGIITPPSQLTLIPASETEINLFWQDNSHDERGFEIYRSEDNGLSYEFVAKTKPNIVHFSDTGLKPNTNYVYNMRAVNYEGSSVYTGDFPTKTFADEEAPSVPGNLIASANLDLQSVTLNWTPAIDNVGVTDYIIYEVQGNTLDSIGSTSATTFLVDGLTESTFYTFVVKAMDASKNISQASNQASVETVFCGLKYTLYVTDENLPYESVHDFLPSQIVGTGTVPNFDIGVRSAHATDLENYFGFEFEGNLYIEDAENYDFVLNSDDGSVLWIDGQEVVSIDEARGPGDSYIGVKYLTSGKHTIKVRYFEKTGGNSLEVKYRKTNSGNAIEPIPNGLLCNDDNDNPIAPNAPSHLNAVASSMTTIDLNWTDNSNNENGFEVYRAKAASGPFELVHTTGEDATTYEDTGLIPQTTYFYQIRSIGTHSQSAYVAGNNGINYQYYEGSWEALPNFSELSPNSTGTIDNFGLGHGERSDQFAYIFEGSISIGEAGEYTFYTNSDDGSMLYINNIEVVNNDGSHSEQEKSGIIELTSGTYPIRVEYLERGGDQVLEVRYEGRGIDKQLIPDQVLNFVSATTLDDGASPTAPTNLTVLNKSATTVGLSWSAATDNVGVTGYMVYHVPLGGEEPDTLAITDRYGNIVVATDDSKEEEINTSMTTFSSGTPAMSTMSLLSETATPTTVSTEVGGLEPETDYRVVVVAMDAAGNLSGYSNLETFTTNNDPSVLPIDLISFSGKAKNNSIKLDWKTASEQDNDYFTIERADNGTDFIEIATVEGAGTSATEKAYSFTDYNPVVGTMFYRLKQTDFNGDFEYSNIISVQFPSVTSAIDNALKNLVLYPNPTSSENINLKLEGVHIGGMANIKIVDMIGKTHLAYWFETKALSKGLKVHTERRLTPGLYIIIIEQANKVTKLKLIINE